MTRYTAQTFTLNDAATVLEKLGCFENADQRDRSVALIRQSAADLAARPTRDELANRLRHYENPATEMSWHDVDIMARKAWLQRIDSLIDAGVVGVQVRSE